MNTPSKFLKFEFEARIFVSFSIVILVCIISFGYFGNYPATYELLLSLFGLAGYSPIMFLFASFIMAVLSLLRMWAGSLLTSDTVMSFRVKTESLVVQGPYLLSRNPIYLSDLIAMATFSMFLPPTGLLMPLLFYFHYINLIRHEEVALALNHPVSCSKYFSEVPRLIPTFVSWIKFLRSKPIPYLNYDGFRRNALYVLFVPAFIAGYFLDSFLWTVIIGIPGVIDWASIHTLIGLPKQNSKNKQSKVFSSVLYSQCWEDPQIDIEALNIRSDDVVFSITSGGCNLLAFLLHDPRTIIALDLNPCQNYLFELKIASFDSLPYNEMLEFMGVRKCSRRTEMYNVLRPAISQNAREYWDKNIISIKDGLLHCGRYEKYMGLLRTCLKLIVSRTVAEQFFATDSKTARKKLYEKHWDNWRWNLFTRALLSRKTMSLLFDKSFFKYLKEDFSFGEHFAEKVKHALTELPVKENYFMRYILFGNYDEKYLPPYLKAENYELIRSRIGRIRIVTDSCSHFFGQLPDDSISKFNFTNIFEWISEEEFRELLTETVRVSRDTGVMTYRNLLVPREHPVSMSGNIESLSMLSKELHEKDLSFIYNNYVVERIYKRIRQCHTESQELRLEMR